MPVLHLGVIDDLPYGQKGTVTTGDVAGWLEDKYHILEIYSQVHGPDMATAMEEGARGALESLLMGAPATIDVFAGGASKIEEGMKEFITNGEMDSLGYPGVPTQAAIDRALGKKRSGRKKKRGRRSNSRPVSFVDTELYESSLRAWVT